MLPTGDAGDGRIRGIAGSYGGVEGPARTHTPISLWDIIITAQGAQKEVELTIPEGHNTLLFVRKGSITLGNTRMGGQQVALMEQPGTTLRFCAEEASQVVLLGGEPLDEPIAA